MIGGGETALVISVTSDIGRAIARRLADSGCVLQPAGRAPARLVRQVQDLRVRTGCPVLVNTSFNVRGEPIVCTPEDAFRCLMGTDLDLLVAGTVVIRKASQDPALRRDVRGAFGKD